MTRSLARVLLALALLAGVSCGSRDVGDDLGPVGSFSLTERDGGTVTDNDLRGEVWVASFVFVRCTGPCPQVTATMARMQQELDLANQKDLRLVTFTVDPERDRPKELQVYADNFNADRGNWLFLTGEKEKIHKLLIEGFKVAVAEKPADARTPGDEFAHSTRLVVVDKKGHIRGYFDGLPIGSTDHERQEYEKGLKKLKDQVKALLRE